MKDRGHHWILLLATGRPAVLPETLQRAARVAAGNRICALVAEEHRFWWYSKLTELAPANVVVQPEYRGTAVSILLPLLRIELRDPDAHLVLVPSRSLDCDEGTLSRALERAADEPSDPAGRILLLSGPRRAPGETCDGLVMAAHLRALLGLFERRFPELVDDLRCAVRHDATFGRRDAVAEYYAGLPNIDFSRHVVEGQASYLHQVEVPRRTRRVRRAAGRQFELSTTYAGLQPAL